MTRPLRATATDRASEIAADIRAQILAGRLRPGDSMPTTATLTSRYGVAPPTMRAALRLLEAEGLVKVHRGAKGGPRVQALDVSALARQAELHLRLEQANLDDLLEALLLIQPGAVKLAAERRTAAQLRRLKDTAARVGAATTMGQLAEATADFLLLLLEASGNPVLRLFERVIDNLVRHEIHQELGDRPSEDLAAFIAERYAEVVLMIELREGEAAAALWRAHLMMTHPAMKRAVAELRDVPHARARSATK